MTNSTDSLTENSNSLNPEDATEQMDFRAELRRLTMDALLPVRSRGMVKKGELRVLFEKLKATVAEPLIKIGKTIVASVGESAVDIVAMDNVIWKGNKLGEKNE